jgi:hypothetical protein
VPEPLYSFDYALIRVVPRVECEQFVNAGLILHCPEQQFLGVAIRWNEAKARSLWPEFDLDGELLQAHLQAFHRVAAGEQSAGPIALLSRRERFHWLTSPRSTVIQISPVHSGLCSNSQASFERLCNRHLPVTSTG